ncbi:MAG: ATP-binding protein [Halobacteriales archaeon]
MSQLPGSDLTFLAYLVAFGAAGAVCLLSLVRARRIDDDDTRRGLLALLATSGGWAFIHVAFLVVPSRELKVAAYIVGLIVGLSTVGPWLYFCSAYTGRSLHRNTVCRRVAVGAFAAVVLLKVTNPIHGVYFTSELVSVPFPHLAVTPGVVHWMILGIAYLLAAVGYFMLFELFSEVGHNARPLGVLAGLAAVPVVLDVAALKLPWLLELNYEPLGVAVFGAGVVFLYLEDFRAVQLAGESDDAVVVLDDVDRIRDYNSAAAALFPELDGAVGESIEGTLPNVGPYEDGEQVMERNVIGGMRYYQVTESPFTANKTRTGTLLSFTDVTDQEEYCRELERQNERLEQFASMVSHDLRNPLSVAKGNIELARKDGDREELEAAAEALDRMEALIEDLLALAREGQPLDERERVTLSAIAEDSWGMVSTTEADITIEGDLAFTADSDRLRQLLENLYRNAIEHGRDDVTITVGALDDGTGFYVADDGPGIPPGDREEVFASGYTTSQDGTGFGLAIVREIAEAHGWEVGAAESESGGARFEIRGVERVE